ncbi:MAG: PH domain-containing protein [Rikenellaceae bacterium]
MEKIIPRKVENFVRSKYVRIYTNSILILILLITIALLFLSSGTFLSGWFFVTSCIVLLLIFISAPKHLVVYQDKIVVQCIVESTVIHIDQIESIKEIKDIKITDYIPLYSSLGFLGFVGFFLDHKHDWHLVHILCTNMKNCIEITTKNHKRYIISIPLPEELKTDTTIL